MMAANQEHQQRTSAVHVPQTSTHTFGPSVIVLCSIIINNNYHNLTLLFSLRNQIWRHPPFPFFRFENKMKKNFWVTVQSVFLLWTLYDSVSL